MSSSWIARRALHGIVVASALVFVSTVAVSPDAAGTAPGGPSRSSLDRLVRAHHDPKLDPSRAEWRGVVTAEGFDTEPVDVLELVKLSGNRHAKARYDRYVSALRMALAAHGATMVSVADVLQVGVGRFPGYAGGVSWLARFPSRKAFVETMLDRDVIAASNDRRAGAAAAQVLAGSNLVPDFVLNLPPNSPASAFPSARVQGKSPREIVDEVLSIYPAGGSHPTRSVLDRMVRYRGFADQPLVYINLYEFVNQEDQLAALKQYDSAALPFVLAHGVRPKSIANVSHQLVGPPWDQFIVVGWPSFAVFTDLLLDPGYSSAEASRVIPGTTYGNLIMLPR
jgi:uncharacterized protein (DUF1330 family)